MARKTNTPPRTRQSKATSATHLHKALKFISIAQRGGASEGFSVYQKHCSLLNNWAIAFDGVLMCGHPIIEDIDACPHTFTLLDGIDKAGSIPIAFTMIDGQRLQVKADRFTLSVPCVERSLLAPPQPDIPIATIDDRIRDAFKACTLIGSNSGETVVDSALLLQSGSAVSTDRKMIIEYWHGIDLPPGLLIPRASAVTISKIDKPLKQFGFSANSVTFYYEDGAWIKTQLYAKEKFPNYLPIFREDGRFMLEVPQALYLGAAYLQPFGTVAYIHNGKMSTSPHEGEGASFETGLQTPAVAYLIEYLQYMQELKTLSFDYGNRHNLPLLFRGGNVRGAITGMRVAEWNDNEEENK